MNAIDIVQWTEILSSLGVIVGIVFLAIEIRQNNELMAAEKRATMVSLMTSLWNTTVDNPDMAELFVKELGGAALTKPEELRMNAFWIRALMNVEYVSLESSNTPAFTAVLRRAFESYGSLRRAWSGGGASALAGRDNFSASFVDFFDQQIARAEE